MKYVFFLLFFYSFFTQSQTLKGSVKDFDGNSIVFSNILIKESSNPASIVEFTNVKNGYYEIELKKTYKNILIEVVSNQFLTVSQLITEPIEKKNYIFDFVLKDLKSISIEEIKVVSEKKPYTIKKDTISFNVDAYKDGSDRKVQDVLKKLPGIEVNEKSGQIKYNGKPVETVTFDGDNLFGYNYSLGTKNINIDMVEQVQAISNYSENPLLKGIEGGEKVSLNLKLKKDKTDYSGNIDVGFGINDNSDLLNNSNTNILRITSNYKSFGVLSYNNIGINHSPFDYFSNNKSIEKINEKDVTTQKVISESLFSNVLQDDRSNINSMLFSNYNSIFKINKRLSFKTNLYYLNDNIKFNQSTINRINFENEDFTTSDVCFSNKKPQFYRGDIELKYNTSKNSLLEAVTKFSYEQIKTFSSILANNVNSYNSSLTTRNSFLNQKLIFTKKLSDQKAIQINVNYAYNDIPQILSLEQSGFLNIQNSNFKKNFFDTKFNILGNLRNIKYSTTFGGLLQNVPYQSKINQGFFANQNNIVKYYKNYLYNLSSLNYTINKWGITPSYSVKILNQSFENDINKKDILFEPSFFIRYKINNKSNISSKLSYSQNPFDEEYIYKNPVFINNRIKISNTPSLEIQKAKIYYLNYFNNNLYSQFILSIGVSYQDNKGAFFSNYIINNNETIINNFFSNEKSNNLSFDFVSEKYVSAISTTIKLKSNYAKSNYKNIINLSETRNNENNVFTNEISFKTAFNTKVNLENDFIYNFFKNKTDDNSAIENKSFTNSCKIKYKYSQKIFTVVNADYFLPNTNNKSNNYLFVDFSLIFKPSNKKYEFNLLGKNLLNNKTFSQIHTSDFSKSTYQSNLLSRYFFVNFTYNF